jgi:hypothetical protein
MPVMRRISNHAAAIAVAAACIMGVAAVTHPISIDPGELTGAAVDTCFDCKDVICAYCPKPAPCRELGGYCRETVRNLSQFCAPRLNGQWEQCKWRVDPAGSCITELLNPCMPERPACATPIGGCGPMGICIPEGVCIP